MTRSQRRKRTSRTHNTVILVWPPPPQRDAVSIMASDMDLLEPEEFLNDTIIDFYIKYIQQRSVLDPGARFHFFNCFIYKMIAGNASSASNVVSWGANADILSHDYLILPVNESMHWLLAIVCFPRDAVEHEARGQKDEAICLDEDTSTRAGILLFDSMSSHARASKITKSIRQ